MKLLVLSLIKGYQKLISPLFPPHCRFYPSCYEYGFQSIEAYGILKGLWMTLIRIGKCHPFHPGGYDPVIKE